MKKWLFGMTVGVLVGAAAVWLYVSLARPEFLDVAGAVPPMQLPSERPGDAPVVGLVVAPSESRILAAMLKDARGFERAAKLHELVRFADAGFLDHLLAEADALPRREAEAAKSIIYSRYAEVAPERALARIMAHGQGETVFVGALFQAWAEHDVDSALIAADGLVGGARRRAGASILSVTEHLSDERRTGIAESFSAQETLRRMRADAMLDADPALAWQEAVAAEAGEARTRAVFQVGHAWLVRDPEAALAAIERMELAQTRTWLQALMRRWAQEDLQAAAAAVLARPASSQRVRMAAAVATAIAEQSPEKALAFAERFAGPERQQVTAAAVTAWGRQDPPAALAALSGIDIGRAAWVGRQAVNRLADQDPFAAFDWVMAQPRSMDRRVMLGVPLRRMAEVAPRAALARVLELRGVERQEGIGYVLAEWARSKPHEAATWVAGDDALPDYDRLPALHSVLRVWGKADAAAAVSWLLSQPDTLHGAASSAIGAFAQESPERAARLVGRLADPDASRRAQSALTTAWAAQDPCCRRAVDR